MLDTVIKTPTIENVYTINADYSGCLYYNLDGKYYYDGVGVNDTIKFRGKDKELIKEIHVPGINEWLNEYELKTDSGVHTIGGPDAEDWVNRGLILAQEIRDQLPDNCDLWFEYPYNDVNHKGERAFLIFKAYEDEDENEEDTEYE